jgi:hypothetical protein
MKINRKLSHEFIKELFTFAAINRWMGDDLWIWQYEYSEIYNTNNFDVIFDNDFNILYVGWETNEAWYKPGLPRKPEYEKISSMNVIDPIRYDKEYYEIIFFDNKGKNLNNGIEFRKAECDDGEVIGFGDDGNIYKITLNGPELKKD